MADALLEDGVVVVHTCDSSAREAGRVDQELRSVRLVPCDTDRGCGLAGALLDFVPILCGLSL